MNTDRSLLSIAAVALLWATAASGAAVDTSKWKCELCPADEKSLSGEVELGVGGVNDDSSRHGDYSGLHRRGTHAVIGGGLKLRSGDGFYAGVQARDLGLDSRAIAGEIGNEGQYKLMLGYAEIPRHLTEGVKTPFIGSGGSVLGLPAGYPAASTGSMPLAATLQPVEARSKRTRIDAGLSWDFGPEWSAKLTARRDERDGTQRTAGSFFSNAAQMLAPIDQVTDQIEASAAFTSGKLHASVGYYGSAFRNGADSLVWRNPFQAGSVGATRGELALAPDNQFNQVMAAAGYELTPKMRISGDMAFGRATQDAAFVAATLNPQLGVRVPAGSLDGKVDVFNANGRITASPTDGLQLSATWARDVHDNRTASLAWPAVSTDLFVGAGTRSNQPFSFTNDRVRLGAEYRATGSLRTAIGADFDRRDRTLQEVVTTREATWWTRVSGRPTPELSMSLKLALANREHSTYGTATWINPPENPLLRKFNLASRSRAAAQGRVDYAVVDNITVGLSFDWASDDYSGSAVGLTDARQLAVGADVSVALGDDTQLHVFAQGDRIRSGQSGSQTASTPDWRAHARDAVDVLGFGLKHSALKGKLELGADLTYSHARSNLTVFAGVDDPAFPSAKTLVDGVRLYASWKLQDNVTLVGSWWYEHFRSRDWRYDGVAPQTVNNLLTLGEQAPGYRINLVRVAVRYRF